MHKIDDIIEAKKELFKKGYTLDTKLTLLKVAELMAEWKVKNCIIPVVSKPLRKPKLTKKMIEARNYVDEYTKTNKRPPTYDEVRIFLGLTSTNTAFHRLRGYREKMY